MTSTVRNLLRRHFCRSWRSNLCQGLRRLQSLPCVLFSPKYITWLPAEFQSFHGSPDSCKAGAALKVGSSDTFRDMTCLNLHEAVEKLITRQITWFVWNCTMILDVIKLPEQPKGGREAGIIRPPQTDWKLDKSLTAVAHVLQRYRMPLSRIHDELKKLMGCPSNRTAESS